MELIYSFDIEVIQEVTAELLYIFAEFDIEVIQHRYLSKIERIFELQVKFPQMY